MGGPQCKAGLTACLSAPHSARLGYTPPFPNLQGYLRTMLPGQMMNLPLTITSIVNDEGKVQPRDGESTRKISKKDLRVTFADYESAS